MLGLVLTWMRQHDASITEIERAIALNPNYVDWRFGMALVLAGNPKRAIDVLECYMRLDPFHEPWASFLMGAAYFVLKDYQRALAILQDYVSRVPGAAFGHSLLAATHAQLGRLDEARAEAAELLRLRPAIRSPARPGVSPRSSVRQMRNTSLMPCEKLGCPSSSLSLDSLSLRPPNVLPELMLRRNHGAQLASGLVQVSRTSATL
jgi:tetratricopeptide (TPR) repeat protein